MLSKNDSEQLQNNKAFDQDFRGRNFILVHMVFMHEMQEILDHQRNEQIEA